MTATGPDMFRLDGRRALVTGASRGIGRAIAIGLGRQGADVTVHYASNQAAARSTLQAIEAAGATGRLVQADLVDPAAADRLADAVTADGGPDILVLNAAIQERQNLGDVDHALVQRHVDANFWSALRLIQATLPAMIERRWGRVLAIGSV